MKKYVFSILLLLFSSRTLYSQTTVYVAPGGSDSNPGSLAAPFKTIYKGMQAVATRGGLVYLRGGTYGTANMRSGYTYCRSALAGPSMANPIKVWAYPGERPVIDFNYGSSQGQVFWFDPDAKYYHLKGLEIREFQGDAVCLQGKGFILERLTIHNGGNPIGNGIINGRPTSLGGVRADSVQIINCDIYDCFDEPDGESTDGIRPAGKAWTIRGCRIWGISDDGMELWESPDPIRVDSCWIFGNGRGTDGNGNGMKLGGHKWGGTPRHIITNCLTAYNRANGMHQNTEDAGMYVYNCTSYKDGYGWNFNYASANPHTLKNNIVYAPRIQSTPVWLYAGTIQTTNSWNGFTVTDADFQSIDTTGIRGPRGPNGELPVLKFLKLASTSRLIDGGVGVGMPFTGRAPDVGAFEYNTLGKDAPAIPPSDESESSLPKAFALAQNFPNPFNPSTTIRFSLPVAAHVKLIVFNGLGQEVRTLVDEVREAGYHEARLDGTGMASGVYFYRMQAGDYIQTRRLCLIK